MGAAELLVALSRRRLLLGALLYVAGIAWTLSLAADWNTRRSYLSENALGVGKITAIYDRANADQAKKWSRELNATIPSARRQWLQKAITSVGAEPYEFAYGGGINIEVRLASYAVLRAPKGDGTESVAIVAGRPQDVPFVLSLVSVLQASADSLAKDVVAILPLDADDEGSARRVCAAWLQAYVSPDWGRGSGQGLQGRAGALQAAFIVEAPSVSSGFAAVEFFTEGPFGRLPNLDIVNAASALSLQHGVRVVQHGIGADATAGEQIVSALLMLCRLAVGGCGAHGPFLGWQIDAFTLRAVETPGAMHRPELYGRIVEGTLRSANNLLERLHQSFFLYVLPGPGRFVSIAHYIPATTLFVVGLLVVAVGAWIALPREATYGTLRTAHSEVSQSVAEPIGRFGLSVICAAGASAAPSFPSWGMVESGVAACTLAALLLAGCLALLRKAGEIAHYESAVLACVACAYAAAGLLALSVVHFASALVVGAVAVPACLCLAAACDRHSPWLAAGAAALAWPVFTLCALSVGATCLGCTAETHGITSRGIWMPAVMVLWPVHAAAVAAWARAGHPQSHEKCVKIE